MNLRTRFRIFMRDDFTCQYCGVKAPATELHVDHIHPRSLGGADTDDNLTTACIACNSGKTNLILPVTYRYGQGGPKDGVTRRRDKYPMEWVYEAFDGTLLSLNDAQTDDGDRRWILGPNHWERAYPSPSVFEGKVRELRERKGDAPRLVRLLGAYVSHGVYPNFKPEMEWMDCEQIILQFDLSQPYVEGMRRAIIDVDG